MTKEECIDQYAGINYSDQEDVIVRFILISMYFFSLCFASYRFLLIFSKHGSFRSTQITFTCIIISANIVRVSQLPLSNSLYAAMDPSLSTFLNSFPDFLFFAAYLVVLCHWAVVFQLSSVDASAGKQDSALHATEFQKTLYALFVRIVLFALIALIVVSIVAAFVSIYDVPIISGVYIAILSCFLALFAGYQGFKIYYSLRDLSTPRPGYEMDDASFANSPHLNTRVQSATIIKEKQNGSKFRDVQMPVSAFESPFRGDRQDLPPYFYVEPDFNANAPVSASPQLSHISVRSNGFRSALIAKQDAHDTEALSQMDAIAVLIESAIRIRNMVTIVACVCTFFFLMKGILVCLLNVLFCPRNNIWVHDSHHYLYIWCTYMFFADIFPALLILLLLGSAKFDEEDSKEKAPLVSNGNAGTNYGSNSAHVTIKDGFLVLGQAPSALRLASVDLTQSANSHNPSTTTSAGSASGTKVSAGRCVPAVSSAIFRVPSSNKLHKVQSHVHVAIDGSVDPDVLVHSYDYSDPVFQAHLEAELHTEFKEKSRSKTFSSVQSIPSLLRK